MDFAEFYRRSKDDCLRTVLISVADQDTAQGLVEEAFARASESWSPVSRHPAPVAWVVRTALNVNISRWRRRRREVSVPDPGTIAGLRAISGASESAPAAAAWPATAGRRPSAVPRPGYRPHRGGARHRAQHGQGASGPCHRGAAR